MGLMMITDGGDNDTHVNCPYLKREQFLPLCPYLVKIWKIQECPYILKSLPPFVPISFRVDRLGVYGIKVMVIAWVKRQ